MAVSSKLRSVLLKGGLLLFLCCLFCFPATALAGAKDGLLLWFHQVMPSLLPFLILSSLFLSTGLSDRIAKRLSPFLSPVLRCSPSGCYAVVIGLLSGLPIGAKTVGELTRSSSLQQPTSSVYTRICFRLRFTKAGASLSSVSDCGAGFRHCRRSDATF